MHEMRLLRLLVLLVDGVEDKEGDDGGGGLTGEEDELSASGYVEGSGEELRMTSLSWMVG